jgi:tetratricopeptide (TPR) repeat protein
MFLRPTAQKTDMSLSKPANVVELDPNFGSAYAMAAYCHARRLYFGQVADREGDKAEAERLARRATSLGLDDAMALSATALASVFASRNFNVSIALIERALMLNPNLGVAWYANGLIRLYNGEPELAIAHFKYAMRLSPFDPLIGNMWRAIAFAHLLAGRYDQSLLASEQGGPDDASALTVLAASSALAGRVDKARTTIARIRKHHPTLSISMLKSRSLCRRPEDFARYAEGLRMAGLPE